MNNKYKPVFFVTEKEHFEFMLCIAEKKWRDCFDNYIRS